MNITLNYMDLGSGLICVEAIGDKSLAVWGTVLDTKQSAQFTADPANLDIDLAVTAAAQMDLLNAKANQKPTLRSVTLDSAVAAADQGKRISKETA